MHILVVMVMFLNVVSFLKYLDIMFMKPKAVTYKDCPF